MPLDTRVDPNLFPEDEFPVYCPSCDYLLRGLTDSRCPECGTPFDRGRLLVEQYVVEQNRRQWPWTSKWVNRTGILGFLILLGWTCLWPVLHAMVTSGTDTLVIRNRTRLLLQAGFYLLLLFLFCMVLSAGLAICRQLGSREQSKRVEDQIARDSPSCTQHARRLRRVTRVVMIVVMGGICGFAFMTEDGPFFRYLSRDPVLLLVPIGLAAISATILILAPHIRKWRRNP